MTLSDIPKDQWIQWAGWAIAIGFIAGVIVVGFLYLTQAHLRTNQVLTSDQYLGLKGVVTVPFNHQMAGKMRVNLAGRTVEKWAITDQTQGFERGSIVYVVGAEDNLLWVIAEQDLSLEP